MIDIDESGSLQVSEFIGPLSRWARDSKTESWSNEGCGDHVSSTAVLRECLHGRARVGEREREREKDRLCTSV